MYVYRNDAGEECEVLAPTYEPALYAPPGFKLVIQPSSIRFGDMEIGDDDFSLRYRSLGVNTQAKRNNTQGKTNVNAILRKWGKQGMPLEARKDIDTTKTTIGGVKPAGVHSVEAPPALRSSAGGISTKDLSA